MTEVPVWLTIALAAVVPCCTVIGFWMALGSRIAKAEIIAEGAKKDAEEANGKATLLSASFSLYREQIAGSYIHREVMREIEDRLTQAIDRLADRLDRVLERAETRK